MKRACIFIFIVAISLALTSCSMSKIEAMKQQNNEILNELEQLKKENQELKIELEEIKFGAGNLFKQIDTYYTEKSYDKAVSVINTLLERHPDSNEALKAKEIKVNIDNIKAEEDRVRAAELKKKMDEEKKRLEQATSKMRKQVDEVNDITWYYNKSTTQHVNVNSFHTYIGQKKDGELALKLRIQYAGDNWLFIYSYELKIDENKYDITPYHINSNYNTDVYKDNNTGAWEWSDMGVDSKKMEIIKAIIESKKAIIRYEGKQYYYDRIITDSEKKALKNVLDAYKALGGSV